MSLKNMQKVPEQDQDEEDSEYVRIRREAELVAEKGLASHEPETERPATRSSVTFDAPAPEEQERCDDMDRRKSTASVASCQSAWSVGAYSVGAHSTTTSGVSEHLLNGSSMVANRGSEHKFAAQVTDPELERRAMSSTYVNAGYNPTRNTISALKLEFLKPTTLSSSSQIVFFARGPLGFTFSERAHSHGLLHGLHSHEGERKTDFYVDSVEDYSYAAELGVKEGWILKKIKDEDVTQRDIDTTQQILAAAVSRLSHD